jgi:hypothetical protein
MAVLTVIFFSGFWKCFTILNVIRDIHDLGKEVKISVVKSFWNNLIPTLMDGFETFKTSFEKVSVDMVDT